MQVGDDMKGAGKEDPNDSEHGAAPESQVAQQSRWQAVLLEAGGLSAALSEESMCRLKYFLHWLQVRFVYLILLLLHHQKCTMYVINCRPYMGPAIMVGTYNRM